MDQLNPISRARLDEAATLLVMNQRARLTGLILVLTCIATIAVGTFAAIALHDANVLLPCPSFALLAASFAAQQYAEVSVLGAARAHLEARIALDLEGVLIYESRVSPLRQHPPLVAGVRLLQATTAVVIAAAIITGVIVAFDGRPWAVPAGYSLTTAVCLASAVMSYRDMLLAPRVAARELPVDSRR